jgi:hypothetical protein
VALLLATLRSVSVFFGAFNLHLPHIHQHHLPFPPRLIQLPLAGEPKLTAREAANLRPCAQFVRLWSRVHPNSLQYETGCGTRAPYSNATSNWSSTLSFACPPRCPRRSRCRRNTPTISTNVARLTPHKRLNSEFDRCSNSLYRMSAFSSGFYSESTLRCLASIPNWHTILLFMQEV